MATSRSERVAAKAGFCRSAGGLRRRPPAPRPRPARHGYSAAALDPSALRCQLERATELRRAADTAFRQRLSESRARTLGCAAVSDYTIPEPEPKEIDEQLSVELGHMVDIRSSVGIPQATSGVTTAATTSSRTRTSRTAGTRSSASWSGGTGGASGGRRSPKMKGSGLAQSARRTADFDNRCQKGWRGR